MIKLVFVVLSTLTPGTLGMQLPFPDEFDTLAECQKLADEMNAEGQLPKPTINNEFNGIYRCEFQWPTSSPSLGGRSY